ncbi:hypothetical protein SAMN06296378_2587 [Salinibacterium xinjiangense]|uniref:Uncharacterized protein n=1 Tax=Salinibacterium xinjiangense TaxID=386302 RepID=A0A2C9A143_9MICO|nr:hypothetical protein SAMN06296378_2587 [Salinibacterium xinjiangense]
MLLLARKRNPRRDAALVTLDDQQLATALVIASAIAAGTVQHAMVSAIEDVTVKSAAAPAFRREVHQATEIILV